MEFKLGEKYKLFALGDLEKTGDYEVFEVIMHDNELSFLSHEDQGVYDLNFLGYTELVKLLEE